MNIFHSQNFKCCHKTISTHKNFPVFSIATAHGRPCSFAVGSAASSGDWRSCLLLSITISCSSSYWCCYIAQPFPECITRVTVYQSHSRAASLRYYYFSSNIVIIIIVICIGCYYHLSLWSLTFIIIHCYYCYSISLLLLILSYFLAICIIIIIINIILFPKHRFSGKSLGQTTACGRGTPA